MKLELSDFYANSEVIEQTLAAMVRESDGAVRAETGAEAAVRDAAQLDSQADEHDRKAFELDFGIGVMGLIAFLEPPSAPRAGWVGFAMFIESQRQKDMARQKREQAKKAREAAEALKKEAAARREAAKQQGERMLKDINSGIDRIKNDSDYKDVPSDNWAGGIA